MARVPVIYSTDLLHPHDDPDDYFDLACLYALPEIDLRAIVLDRGEEQAKRPGWRGVHQLNALTGRHVPAAIGLAEKLASPTDTGHRQSAAHQMGVNLILQTLSDSRERVAIAFVGSARDVVAAYNREPALFRQKVRSVHGFLGEASDPAFVEWNVSLDPMAYVGLMRAPLPLFWIPCFDGGLWQMGRHGSYWKIRHGQILENAPTALLRFFSGMLRHETGDPLAGLTEPLPPAERRWLMEGERNMWGGALLGLVASHRFPGIDFAPVCVAIGDDAVVRYEAGPNARRLRRFAIADRARYPQTVTAATAQLLAAFPVRKEFLA